MISYCCSSLISAYVWLTILFPSWGWFVKCSQAGHACEMTIEQSLKFTKTYQQASILHATWNRWCALLWRYARVCRMLLIIYEASQCACSTTNTVMAQNKQGVTTCTNGSFLYWQGFEFLTSRKLSMEQGVPDLVPDSLRSQQQMD